VYIGQDLQVAFPSYLNIDDISGSFNSVTTSFALTVNGSTPVPLPINSQQCLISVGGIIQRPDDTGTEGFRLSGSNIVFSSAPNTGEDFFGTILAGADYINAGVNFPDGQSGAPSITFDQDLDTGFFRSSSGAVSFSSNGVNTATLGSNSFTAPSFIPTSSSVPSNGVFLPAANSVAIATNGTQQATVDSSGRLLIGTSTSRGVGTALGASEQIETTGYVGLSMVQNSNDNGGLALNIGKSRGTAVGATTIVQNNDSIGTIFFAGADGTDLESFAASISVQVDGTPIVNGMPGRLVFSTTPSGSASSVERMRISNSGVVMIARTSVYSDGGMGTPDFQLGGVSGARSGMACIQDSTATTGAIGFANPNGFCGSINTSGTSTSYNTSSDYRLKENVTAVTDGITRLQQLRPSRFNFIADSDTVVDGFIAHEAQEVVPECVTGTEDEVDADGNPVYQGIDQSKLVPLLTAALQEAVAKIESLEARLTAAGL
jgi:hypothetical protein